MGVIRGISARLRALLHPRTADRDLDEEMTFHLEREAEKLRHSGLSDAEARRRALAAFGGVTQAREAHREVRGLPRMDDLWRDTVYAWRALRHSRVFTLTAVLTLSLGIAATTVVVSAVRAIVFPSLPVVAPGQLYNVWQASPTGGTPSTSMGLGVYPAEYLGKLRDVSHDVFDDVAGYQYDGVSIRSDNGARTMSAVSVTPNYFAMLGLRPAAGRFFAFDRDHLEAAEPEAVLNYDTWRSQFGGDSTIIGRTLYVNSRPLTVVGIAPRGFEGVFVGLMGEIWISTPVFRAPAGTVGDSVVRARREQANFTVFGRLKPGVSVQQAEARLALVVPDPYPGQTFSAPPQWRVRLDPVAGIPRMGKAMAAGFTAMLASVVAFVLAIVATNIAGMLLARATARRREVAIRLAVGAGRARIVRQLLMESLVLCAFGAAAGILLARWLVALLPAVPAPVSVRVSLELPLDPAVLAIAVGASLLTGMFTGLVPALQATRFDVMNALRGGVEHAGQLGRLRTTFVVTQFAMSLALLVTAGLFVRALQRALATDPGFDPANVVVARVDLSAQGYSLARGREFYAQLETRLRARPEIVSAGLGVWTPLSGSLSGNGVLLPGEPWPKGQRVGVRYGVVDSGYFATLRIPLLAGPGFASATMSDTARRVVIVNEALSRRFWPDESPLGRSIDVETGGNPNFPHSRDVVGVVRTAKVQSLGEEAVPYAYLPFAQRYQANMLVYARARANPVVALGVLREVVRELDPNIALQQAMPLEKQLGVYVLPQRAAAWFVSVLGLAGLVLAALGVYGMVAYHVAQRTREFGIRLALGAGRRDVIVLAQRRALVLIAAGAGIGAVLAYAVARLAAGFLFGVPPFDPATVVSVAALLGMVAFAASYLPARRAALVDPLESLRGE